MLKPQQFVKFLFLVSVSFASAGYHPSLHWDPRNPLFKQNVEINVLQNSKLNVLCPNPGSVLQDQESGIPQELMYENMWIVTKEDYDMCKVNISAGRRILSCDSPLKLKYYQMVFRAYSPPRLDESVDIRLEFVPGTKYYFIATSNGMKNSLSNYDGGHCLTSNMKMVIHVCNGSSDPKCIDAPKISPSSSVSSCAPVTERVHHSSTPSLSSRGSSSVLVHQSSPTQYFSTTTFAGLTNTTLALKSSATVQCQEFKASSSEGFLSLFANQSRQLAEICNYTSIIPDLELILQGINSSQTVTQEAQTEHETNVTQNCTKEQNSAVVAQNALIAPACSLGHRAPVLPSCDALLLSGYTLSGIYRIDPLDGNGGFGVNCDNENGGGGWSVILRRYDGSLDFDRGWSAYLEGLGDLTGEFWLGLEKMYRLTGGSYFNLRFDLESSNGIKKYAEYEGCLLDKDRKYKITVGSYSGDAGDSFSYHSGMKFSTKNKDYDQSTLKCAQVAGGGWWFNDCQRACLTGSYENGTHSSQGIVGIQWQAWTGVNHSLSKVEMKIKPA